MGRKTHGPYLVAAIEYNDINKVSDILSTKFRDKQKVKHFLTTEVRRLASDYTEVPLLLAATLDDPTILKYFVTKHDANINYVHEYGFQKPKKRKTALLVAVRRGLYAMVDTILTLNGDINVQDHKGRTALHHAVRRADYRMAKLLLSRGAQVTINDAAGNSPLHIATIFGHMELVRLLMRQGGDLYKKGQHGAIPIHIAAKEGHASLVRMFCEQYEVNVNIMVPCYDEREKAPLHVAATEGHAETVFTLLEHCRADVNLRDSEGETPLHCVAIHEYDPLGMKSKEDFTETVKVLLNYGAEANSRNARGETALHLAARNEFQKIVEVLVLAGTDPLIEDHDKNKAIDLVAPDDTVSKQTLKSAAADREKYMAEAREVRARGFTTNLQNQLPFAGRSQSTMNMLGMHSHGKLNASHGSAFGSNYLLPHNSSSRHIYGGQFRQSSQSQSSSSGSKRKSKDSIQSVPKLPPSMEDSYDIRHRGPMYSVRKAKSVEELDQQSSDRFYPKTGSSSNLARIKQSKRGHRKNSYQESEATSFWDVTPPSSVRERESDAESRRSAKKKTSKPTQKPARDRRLKESDEELDGPRQRTKPKKPSSPMKFLPPKDVDEEMSLGGEESYFLDDDDSFDALDVKKISKKKQKHEQKVLQAMKAREPQVKPGLSSWLDEQARLLKASEKPVAHSTPPLQRRAKSNRHDEVDGSDDDDDDDDESISEDSSISDSESDEQVRPQVTKPKPVPPPKPVKDSVARMGVPVFPMMGSKESLNPKSKQYKRDNPDVEQVVQLEVNESFNPGETVIRVIPVNPGGPEKVHKIPQGASATTFLRLQGDNSGTLSSEQMEFPENQGKKKKAHKKPDLESSSDSRLKNSKPIGKATGNSSNFVDHKKSKELKEPVSSESTKKPVARPREGKVSTSSVLSHGNKGRLQPGSLSGSQSSSASSDELALAPPSQKGQLPAKPVDKVVKLPQNQAVAATPSKKPAGLIFQRAGAEHEDSKDNSDIRQQINLENNKSKDSSVLSKVDNKHSKGENKALQQGKTSSKQVPENDSESEETESSEDEDDDDEDDADSADGANSSPELRTINLTSDGNLSYTLVGGNVDGVFVHALDRTSEAAKQQLYCGDQILKANGQVILGRTREEALTILRSITGPTSLLVRRMPQKYRAAVKNEGMTDSLFVRAHFTHEPAKRGELRVNEGDVFCVTDTYPDGNIGSWKAQKLNPKEDEDPNGFIPNRAKADQLTLKQNLTHGKIAPDQRGGAFLRSFRRAKSADRNSRGQDDDEKLLATYGIVSYEAVSQKMSNVRRPIVVLGLFCDIVISRLAKDAPDLFEAVTDGVENMKDSKSPVNLSLLHTVMNRGKHPLTILSPPSIEFLQQKTDLSPIVIYLSPVSKVIVKSLKAKLSPFYNKNTGYMYDEAVRFEKNYAHLFSAVVPYTDDDWWFFHLKEAITRVQKQPIWESVNQKQFEAKIVAEMNKIHPEPVLRQQQQSHQVRASRDKTARMSRTTDDLPSSPTKNGSTPSPESLSSYDGKPKSIIKQHQPSTSSISSFQEQPSNTTFHRLHSHHFESNSKKKAQKSAVQVKKMPS